MNRSCFHQVFNQDIFLKKNLSNEFLYKWERFLPSYILFLIIKWLCFLASVSIVSFYFISNGISQCLLIMIGVVVCFLFLPVLPSYELHWIFLYKHVGSTVFFFFFSIYNDFYFFYHSWFSGVFTFLVHGVPNKRWVFLFLFCRQRLSLREVNCWSSKCSNPHLLTLAAKLFLTPPIPPQLPRTCLVVNNLLPRLSIQTSLSFWVCNSQSTPLWPDKYYQY